MQRWTSAFLDARAQKSLLAVGFLLVSLAIALSHLSPATTYEVSIYDGTPALAWGAAGIAIVIAIAVAAGARSNRVLGVSVGLAAIGVIWVIAQPILRGYFFYGFNDSLNHMGWTLGLVAESLNPFTLFYPGSHVTAAGLSVLGGATVQLAMLLIVLLFALAYLVFVPLLAYQLVPDRRVAVAATFGAFLFLPVNLAGFKLMYFPFSFATFLVPMALYFLVRHAMSTPQYEGSGPLSAHFMTRSAGMFLLTVVGIVIVHAQVAFNLLVVLAGVILAKALFSWRWQTIRAPTFRPISGLTGVFAIVFAGWTLQYPSFHTFLNTAVTSLVGFVTGGAGGGTIISQRGESATSVGASLFEVFWKLFLVDAIFLALAFGAAWLIVARRLDLPGRSLSKRYASENHPGEMFVVYLAISMMVFVPYAVVHLIGGLSTENYFFRHIGFLMVPGTVLGAIGLTLLGRMVASNWSTPRVKQTGAVVAVLLLALSMVTVFPSPFVYLASNHVTQQEFTGYQTTFEHNDDTPLVTVRGIGNRYAETLGLEETEPFGARLTPDRLAGPDSPLESGEMVHFAVYDRTVDTEVVAYRGLRYSSSYFDSIPDRTGVNRVVTNGEYDLYYLPTEVVRKDTSN